jgi:tight adherence protein B
VTAALLSGALALLLWPGQRVVRRGRLNLVAGRPGRPDGVRPADDVPIPVIAGSAAGAVAAVLSTPLVAVLAGIAAFAAARTWTAAQQDRRTDARLLAVTEGLGALAADLRSGRSVEAATGSAVAACADEDTGRALARAIRAPGALPAEGDLRKDGDLRKVLDRISAGVLLSSRTGCSLAAVVTAVEDDLRARHRQRLELRSATAAPRASALLLAGLPVLGLAMGSGVGADPWAVLTTTGTGQVLLIAGVTLEFAGVAWSRGLIQRALR